MPIAPAPLEEAAPRFSWPLQGARTASLKGTRIRAARGSAVTAAADGRVAFEDAAMAGYGRVVIVEHAQGFATVYAGVGEILAPLGATVRAGETIARAGDSQIYFEIRRHDEAVDPAAILQR
ncbi:MAG TPA: M23 family metallopeptidase [Candidatus Eisenbacteria bacterium]|jgi:septal ring factor EnvC (AmiA/AmiB activator)|nr:M23 family metallopeptidase [Candidatus Eisenbacteria bacterium]